MFSQMQTLEHAARISLADYRDVDARPAREWRLATALSVAAIVVAFGALALVASLF